MLLNLNGPVAPEMSGGLRSVFVGLADAFRKSGRYPAREKRSHVELLPSLGPDHDRDFRLELHDCSSASFRDASQDAHPESWNNSIEILRCTIAHHSSC